MKYILICLTGMIMNAVTAQIPDAVYAPNIKTVQLFPYGNQLGFPVISLNSSDRLELHFDDISSTVRNYSYTFQLCNADWTPAMLSTFDYLSGFSQVRLTTYRVSSVAFTRYVHYQATLPDRNCVPTKAGNYVLKVFRDGDTSKLLFTKRVLVIRDLATAPATVVQPFNGQIFQTHQKLQFKVNLGEGINLLNAQQQIKVVLLQNYRWDNAVQNIRPTFVSRNTLEYNVEADAVFAAGKEWRWIDLRSFRLQSDRVENAKYSTTSTEVFVKPDADRSQQRFNFFRDMNGLYRIEASESINPYWQADYATVHFSFVPPGKTLIPNKDIFLFGKLSDYNLNDSAKMKYNVETGVYERSLFLKQGYYDYSYVTIDRGDPKRKPGFELSEGNYWETENEYTILMYYRGVAERYDQLIGMTTVNSFTGRR
ncbi:MAG: DUF5103 domain-containing protein [Chitinophagaceae bacterium]|nr:MAG: DUF5103 domain-containing protein [Chitinophagaceae bacterium]